MKFGLHSPGTITPISLSFMQRKNKFMILQLYDNNKDTKSEGYSRYERKCIIVICEVER